jgi:alanine-synthesizing transaminase
MSSGDVAIVPSPSYPIHTYGCIIADAEVKYVPVVENQNDFLESIREAVVNTHPKPKMIIMNFPCNPTAQCVTLEFWEKLVEIALEHKIYILQDLAYADITFDNYITPSILQVKNAKKVAVEFFSLSKSYNMPGWRIGFCCGNKKLVSALARFKSYHDYGTFAPLQIAAIEALEGDQQCARDICAIYKSRRDILCDRLNSIGWLVEKPKATMFVWAKIPKKFSHLNSLEFCKFVINEAHVVLSPGSGFGPYGEGYVRFALIENEERIRQAIRNIKKIL